MPARQSLSHANYSDLPDNSFTCPHCGTLQVTEVLRHGFGAFLVVARQCRSCRDVHVRYKFEGVKESWIAIYPDARPWPGRPFNYLPVEVQKAYDDARRLYSVHTGAAGAYVRRALELLLDSAGYVEKTLDASIKAAKAETDVDRRLPKRLLQKLDYIREIGNFALHMRRNAELAIVEITDEEVGACLETVEELVQFLYEDPVADYLGTIELNRKLAVAGKRAIELPPLPQGVVLPSPSEVEPETEASPSTSADQPQELPSPINADPAG